MWISILQWVASLPPFPSGNGLWVHLLLSICPYHAPVITEALKLLYREVILMRGISYVCHDDPGFDAKRVQFHRVIHLRHSLVVAPQGLDKAPVLQMGVCIIGIELEGKLVLFLCFGPVPVVFEGLGQRKMSFCERRIEFQCFFRRYLCV